MNIAVMGAGAWGTAMAMHLQRIGHTVTLIAHRTEHAIQMLEERQNSKYLSGHIFNPSMQIHSELKPALLEAEVLLLGLPSFALREQCLKIAEVIHETRSLRAILSLAKGLEMDTMKRPSEVIREILPGYIYGTLTGPTYAAEVAEGKPTALVFASDFTGEEEVFYQRSINNTSLRVYRSSDLIGAELGGCLKNVYAIASGISQGLDIGDNANAALITRAMHEMVGLGQALGGRRETFYGLSGFGDLIATCNGVWSRNRSFGEAIGRGEKISDLLAVGKTVEGYRSAKSFFNLCKQLGLDAPILSQVYAMLYENKNPRDAVFDLMMRDIKAES